MVRADTQGPGQGQNGVEIGQGKDILHQTIDHGPSGGVPINRHKVVATETFLTQTGFFDNLAQHEVVDGMGMAPWPPTCS